MMLTPRRIKGLCLNSLVGTKALHDVLQELLLEMWDDSGEAEREHAIQGLIGILSI